MYNICIKDHCFAPIKEGTKMKSKRIDVAGFILIAFFIVLGLITLYIGIFMPELMDAVYSGQTGVGIQRSFIALVQRIGFRPVGIVGGIMMLAVSVYCIHTKTYLKDETVNEKAVTTEV
jgi:hypothetical protein